MPPAFIKPKPRDTDSSVDSWRDLKPKPKVRTDLKVVMHKAKITDLDYPFVSPRPHAPVEYWVQDRPVGGFRDWVNADGPFLAEADADQRLRDRLLAAREGIEYRVFMRIEGAQRFTLQARRNGGEWMRLREYDDEVDALDALLDKQDRATPGWEYRVV